MTFINDILTKTKRYLRIILSIRSTPNNIALSFAIGSFIAITPLFGIGILIGLFVAFIFRGLNKIALMSAFIVWNPFLTFPLFTLSYQIGDFFFEGTEIIKYEFAFFNKFFTFTRRFLIGNLIINATVSTVSYFAIRYLFVFYRKRKERRKRKSEAFKQIQ